MSRQLALDLKLRPARGRADFLVAGSNVAAVEWIDRWPHWPSRALAIWGPRASGKTHLGYVWCAASGAGVAGPEDVRAHDAAVLRERHSCLFVDDADGLAGDREAEEALLHLYNYMLETGGALLLASAEAPGRWRIGLPDLASRMRALSGAGIEAPADNLLAAVMVKQFQDRQLRVGEDVIAYLLARIERSFAAVAAVVSAIDAAALERGRAVTVPLAREVIENSGP